MKKFLFTLCFIIYSPCQANMNAMSFMTASDLSSRVGSSNLNLTNQAGQTVAVGGIFLYGAAWINPGENCSDETITGGNSNIGQYMGGTITARMSLTPGQSVAVGQNYLYNMLYTWIYFGSLNGYGFSCALPGCTWPGDTGHYNWCLKLGAESPESTYTHSPYASSVTPFAWPTDSIIDDYAYDLIPNINNYRWLGPFTCNDKTLTCVAATPQFQGF